MEAIISKIHALRHPQSNEVLSKNDSVLTMQEPIEALVMQ
jgi:hypothetical protein